MPTGAPPAADSSARLLWICLILGLIASSSAYAEPATVAPLGDGGSRVIRVQNTGLHPETVSVSAEEGEGLSIRLEGYGAAEIQVQCAEGSVTPPPTLSVRLGDEISRHEIPAVAFEDGPPSLWITSATSGRAQLATALKPTGHRVKHMSLREVPRRFSALRFAPWVMMDLPDLALLDEAQRHAIWQAVAAGTTLVIAVGEGPAQSEALAPFFPGALGSIMRPGPALKQALPQAVDHRVMPGEGQRVLLTADDRPLVLERILGLGRVRLVGTRLKAMTEGPVTDVLFGRPPEPLAHVLKWLSGRPPLSGALPTPLSAAVWALLGGLILMAVTSLKAPKIAAGGAALLWLGACFTPPTAAPVTLEHAEALLVPVGDETLSIGVMDFTLNVGGGHGLPGGGEASLDEARPGGACLVQQGEGRWLIQGEPGARRRLIYFAFVKPTGLNPAGAPEALGAWPPGPLAGASLVPVQPSVSLIPLAADPDLRLSPDRVQAWRVDPAPMAPATPEALVPPAPDEPG